MITCKYLNFLNSWNLIETEDSTGWLFADSGNDDDFKFPTVKPVTAKSFSSEPELSIAILKNFPFSSELQRQSVIVRSSADKSPRIRLRN